MLKSVINDYFFDASFFYLIDASLINAKQMLRCWLQNRCCTLFRWGHLLFTWKTHCGLEFHFVQFHRSEICTEVSFATPEVMWALIMKLPHIEVKFYPEVKSQTGLSSLRVSCTRVNVLLIALCCLDRNEDLLKIFTWPSNNRAFYRPELNL